jgi:hypothetical protein
MDGSWLLWVEIGSRTMFLVADAATAQTIALLVTFLGVGIIANVLIVYIIAEVIAERRQNRERRERGV